MTNPDMPGLEEATSAMLDQWRAMRAWTNLEAMELLAKAAHPFIERAVREKIEKRVLAQARECYGELELPAVLRAIRGHEDPPDPPVTMRAVSIMDIIRGGSDEPSEEFKAQVKEFMDDNEELLRRLKDD